MLKFNVVGIFNELIQNYLSHGVVGRSVKKQLIAIDYIHLRDFTNDVHQSVDDKPFGGGDGMLMNFGPLEKAIKSLNDSKVVYLTPRGRRLDADLAKKWSKSDQPITLICGRYAGIDERFIQNYVDEEVSVGDYVLSGGEVAAMAIIDSVARFVPGVLGSTVSADRDSFSNVLLEGPQFTRPKQILDLPVPEVLTSGHHLKIQEFNKNLSILTTLKYRPDLIQKALEKSQIIKDDILNAFNYLQETLTPEEQKACGFNQAQLLIVRKRLHEI